MVARLVQSFGSTEIGSYPKLHHHNAVHNAGPEHDHSACFKTAPRSSLRRLEHIRAGGHHRIGTYRSYGRGLRSGSLLPGEVLAICKKISSLSRASGRSVGIFVVCRAAIGHATIQCAPSDSRARISVCPCATPAPKQVSASRCLALGVTAPRTAKPASAGYSMSWAYRSQQPIS